MKRLVSLTLALSMILSLAFSSAAVVKPSTPFTEDLKEFILPMYTDNSDYIVYDANDNDITDLFISNTSSFVKSNDWKSISDFYKEHVSFIRHITVTCPQARMSDVAKSQVDFHPALFETPYGIAVEGSYKHFSTIYYDPNTGFISSYNSYIGDIRIPCEYITLKDEQVTGTYSNNHTKISMTLKVCFQYGTIGSSYYVDYGYKTHTVTMSASN